MSWDAELVLPDGTLAEVDLHAEGGTFALGGTQRASLNVTYNYQQVFYLMAKASGMNRMLGNRPLSRWLDGVLAREAHPVLAKLIDTVPPEVLPYTGDYWAPTPGNARHVLEILCRWSEMHPDGRWRVS